MILLTDLVKGLGSNTKVKFNQWGTNTSNPMESYLRDPDSVNNGWFLWHEKSHYFALGQTAICLLKLSYDTWLLTTIKKITKVLPITSPDIGYEAEEIEEYKPLFGRVIIKHKKTRPQGRWLSEIADKLEVLQVLPAVFDGVEFPGYDKVCLSWAQLNTIIIRQRRDWVAALENQKAIYLITDTSNGKQYVGSATGENGMLLQRWTSYIHSGHGGNVGLQDIDFDHVKVNFQYAILENYNARVSKDIILSRESWWKETLQTRKFGYNKN